MCAAPHVSKDFEKLKSPSELDGLSELLSSEGVTDVFLELQSTSTDKPQLIRFLKSRASASLLALEIRSDEPILLEVIPAFENLSELERLHFNRFCVLDAQLSELLKVPLPRLVDLGLFGTGISVEGAALLASSVLGCSTGKASARRCGYRGRRAAHETTQPQASRTPWCHPLGRAPRSASCAQTARR